MFVLSWLTGLVSGPFVVAVIAVGALVATRLTRFAIRRAIRHLSRHAVRAGGSAGPWRVRAARIAGETREAGEQRRRQRIDATARLLNHMVAVVIWVIATIVAFHVLAVDPTFFLSSAGFLGAALAIGGQHKVNDYLTGLNVHLEDRYGIGDEIVVNPIDGGEVQAVVDHIGLFSTRLRDAHGTLHLPNHALASVRNLSQEPAVTRLRVRVPDDADDGDAASVLRGLAGDEGFTDVVVLGQPEEHGVDTGRVDVEVRTSRHLDATAQIRLVERTEREIWDR